MILFVCIATLFLASCSGQLVSEVRSPDCLSRNGYYKKDASCDAYIECVEYKAFNMNCPDGLNYNKDAIWPAYPCGYPIDVPCTGSVVKSAQPTAECPRQYGFFPHPNTTASQCAYYRMCVAGHGIDMTCPVGLAFNPATSRCDWPDLVPSCNVEQFFGFKCPAHPVDADGKPLDVVLNYRYEGSCYYFFSCELGRVRLLSCDAGYAFDSSSGSCVNSDLVKCDYKL